MSQRLFVRLDEDPIQGPESNGPEGALTAYRTSAALQPYVSQILHYRETFGPGQGVVERVLPDGAVRLVAHLGSVDSPSRARGPSLEILGPFAKRALVRLRGTMDSLSITLRAGAAQSLLGVPAGELAGAAVSLADLWGRDSADLLAQLAEQPDVAERVALLQSELERRLPCATSPNHRTAAKALELLVAGRGRMSVREVAATMGLGERRLQQLFHTQIGLSPTAWRRLARLHACLRALRRRPGAAWTDVAVDAGFYDQSHLVNDFRELCGFTPGEFRREVISGSCKTAA